MRRFYAVGSCYFPTIEGGAFWVVQDSSIYYGLRIGAIFEGDFFVFGFVPFYLLWDGVEFGFFVIDSLFFY